MYITKKELTSSPWSLMISNYYHSTSGLCVKRLPYYLTEWTMVDVGCWGKPIT